jgi:HTH-type transcriptional regulator, competence development regulator
MVNSWNFPEVYGSNLEPRNLPEEGDEMKNQSLTSFGLALRKARLDRGETMSQMAKAIDVSSAFLSAVETGHKSVPQELVENVIEHLKLTDEKAEELREAARQSGSEMRIALKGKGRDARDVAAMFARKFEQGDFDSLRKALESLDHKRVYKD